MSKVADAHRVVFALRQHGQRATNCDADAQAKDGTSIH